MRRLLALAVLLGLTASGVPASAVPTAPENESTFDISFSPAAQRPVHSKPDLRGQGPSRTSFSVETESLPEPTMTGGWSGWGDYVTLEFDGVHAVGKYTRFKARWLAPWSYRRQTPHLEGRIFLDGVDALGRKVSFGFLVRYKRRGGEWTEWYGKRKHVISSLGPYGLAGTVSGGPLMQKPRSIRFDVRIFGWLEGPGSMTGDVELMLRDPN